MSDDTPPDEDRGLRSSPRRPEPDAHGQAALLLAESILHMLIETNTVTPAQAADVVRIACEVKIEVAEETDETKGTMEQSLGLLHAIENSLTAGKNRIHAVD